MGEHFGVCPHGCGAGFAVGDERIVLSGARHGQSGGNQHGRIARRGKQPPGEAQRLCAIHRIEHPGIRPGRTGRIVHGVLRAGDRRAQRRKPEVHRRKGGRHRDLDAGLRLPQARIPEQYRGQ